MGALSDKLKLDRFQGLRERPLFTLRLWGMSDQSQIDAGKLVVLRVDDLCSVGLFRRRAEDDNPASDVFDAVTQDNAAARAGGSEQIVRAAVADFRKGVVFREKSDGQAGLSRVKDSLKACFYSGKRRFDCETVFPEQFCMKAAGFVFLAAQFRIFVDFST